MFALTRLRVALALPLTLALVGRSALAQPAPPAPSAAQPAAARSVTGSPAAPVTPTAAVSAPAAPPAPSKAIAAQKYEEGAKLARQGRWQAAYPLFLEAWDNLQHWQIALNLGRAEIEVSRFHAAEGHLAFALAASELPVTDRPEVIRLIELARGKQGKIRLLATAQTAARVLIDDQRIGVTPFSGTLSADPGDHRVEIRFGATRKARVVTVVTGETVDVDIDLRIQELDIPLPPKVSPTAPALVPDAPAGGTSSGSSKMALIGTGAGLTVVALSLGFGLTVASGDRGAELTAKGRFAENQSLENARVELMNGAIWSYIAAGVLGGGTLATLLLWPAPRNEAAAGLRLQWTGLGARAEMRW